jgi:hypothetical protein
MQKILNIKYRYCKGELNELIGTTIKFSLMLFVVDELIGRELNNLKAVN